MAANVAVLIRPGSVNRLGRISPPAMKSAAKMISAHPARGIREARRRARSPAAGEAGAVSVSVMDASPQGDVPGRPLDCPRDDHHAEDDQGADDVLPVRVDPREEEEIPDHSE